MAAAHKAGTQRNKAHNDAAFHSFKKRRKKVSYVADKPRPNVTDYTMTTAQAQSISEGDFAPYDKMLQDVLFWMKGVWKKREENGQLTIFTFTAPEGTDMKALDGYIIKFMQKRGLKVLMMDNKLLAGIVAHKLNK